MEDVNLMYLAKIKVMLGYCSISFARLILLGHVKISGAVI